MGDHELTVTAVDAAGNATEKSIVFHTPEENPVFSNLQAQVDGTDATLTAVVTDPNGDHTDLSFKVGASYTPGDGSTAVFTGSGDYPVSGGEAADWADGLTTQVSYDAPYHRFEVETGSWLTAIRWADLERIGGRPHRPDVRAESCRRNVDMPRLRPDGAACRNPGYRLCTKMENHGSGTRTAPMATPLPQIRLPC